MEALVTIKFFLAVLIVIFYFGGSCISAARGGTFAGALKELREFFPAIRSRNLAIVVLLLMFAKVAIVLIVTWLVVWLLSPVN